MALNRVNVLKLRPGDLIEVAEGVTATVKRIEEIDVYSYHDAPNWVAVETEEFDVPFHFEEHGERAKLVKAVVS